LCKVDSIVFDKTGTITQGKPVVTDIVAFEHSQNDLLQIAASLEHSSEHPLAEAIVSHTRQKNISLFSVSSFEAIPGKGVKGIIDGQLYFL